VIRSAVALAAVGLALLGSACREHLPTNRYLQLRASAHGRPSTADARGKFDHGKHAAILGEQGGACTDCHRFDVLLDTGNEALAREVSARALRPGGEACHFCHGPSDTRLAAAPSACTTCHENLLALRPANHDVAWMKVHASAARADPTACESCHRQTFCISCHQRRDDIQTIVHERNFRFFHGVEARANPMQCGTCHREDFCLNCHVRGGVTP
jgi:hypothetical protein